MQQNNKLTNELREQRNQDIIQFLQWNYSIQEIAESYRLTTATIYDIKRKSEGIVGEPKLTPIPVIAKELNESEYFVRQTIEKFLRLSREYFEDRSISYDDLAL